MDGWICREGERPEFSREIALTDQLARKDIGRLFTKHILLRPTHLGYVPILMPCHEWCIYWWQTLNSSKNERFEQGQYSPK